MEVMQIQHELHVLGMRVPSRRHLAKYYLLIELVYCLCPQWEKGGNYFHFTSVRES